MPIVGDVATVLDDLIPEIQRTQAIQGKPNLAPWWKAIDGWREEYPMTWDEPTDGSLAPQWVIKKLSEMADPSTIWVTVWASTRCGLRSSSILRTSTLGSPPEASARWATVCRPPSAHPWARP